MNTPYAERVRESKRSERVKVRRRELRKRDSQRAKEAAYAREYRKRPEVIAKNKARYIANRAIQNGSIVRPDKCQICGEPDVPLADGRSRLRADHYDGYDKAMTVRFVCVRCDGEQERARGNTTLGLQLATK